MTNENLKKLCISKAEAIYGIPLLSEIKKRIDWELEIIIKTDTSYIFFQLMELMEKCELKSSDVLLRQGTGNSIIMFLCGIGDVDPVRYKLSPYFSYYDDEGLDKFDIALSVPTDFKNRILEFSKEIKVISTEQMAGILRNPDDEILKYLSDEDKEEALNVSSLQRPRSNREIFTNDDLQILHNLYQRTGVKPEDIKFEDTEILNLFRCVGSGGQDSEQMNEVLTVSLGITEEGIPCMQEILRTVPLNSFEDMVKVNSIPFCCNVWENNADVLIKEGVASFDEIIVTRDDVFDYLTNLPMDEITAYNIVERVRRGKGLLAEQRELMQAVGVPEWYMDSCEKVRFLPFRSHCTSCMHILWRLAYFGIYYKDKFYEEYYKYYD